MANTDDLRYVRTEDAIRAAFLELVAEEPISSISVSALCQRASISRNAFYLHHSGIQGLYAALVDELVEDVLAESVASADRRRATGRDDDFGRAVFMALARHESLLRALLPADDGSLAKCLAEGIEEAFVQAALRFGEHGGSLEHRVSCAFSAWAAVGFVSCWIAETDEPLVDAAKHYEVLQAGLAALGAEYLMRSNA